MSALLLGGFVMAVWLAAVPLAGWLCARVGERLPPAMQYVSAWRAALALAPVAAASVAALVVIAPLGWLAGCHCLVHPHHLHLCFDHASFSWPLALACAAAIAGALVGVRRTLTLLRMVRDTHRWSTALPADGQTDCRVLPELGAMAVTVGLLRPRALFGDVLWTALDPLSRDAVVLHERAHVKRRDPLTLVCLELAACFMTPDSGRALVRGWRRAAEVECDNLAADGLGDPLAIAAALVQCGRLQGAAAPELKLALVAAASLDDLELRVRLLVERPTRGSARGDLMPAALSLLAAAALAIACVGGAGHHAMETALGLLA